MQTDKHVFGYRPQYSATVDLVNRNKIVEEHVLRMIEDLQLHDDIDGRWLSVGRTHIEQGFMAINRAIFKPGRVKL